MAKSFVVTLFYAPAPWSPFKELLGVPVHCVISERVPSAAKRVDLARVLEAVPEGSTAGSIQRGAFIKALREVIEQRVGAIAPVPWDRIDFTK